MSTISKERTELKAFITGFLTDPMHDDKSSGSLTAEVFRIALASLEAEDKLSNFVSSQVSLGGEFDKVLAQNLNELYVGCNTAPPAPVSVPDEATPDNIQMLASTFAPCGVTYQWDRDECNAAADSWNACRAAMLTEDKN